MRIIKATLIDFRNLSGTIELCPHINVLFGRNGQGKTNFLEALYVVCHGKSFRPGKLSDMVRFEREFATAELEVEQASVVTPVRLVVSGAERRLSVGGRENCSLAEVGEALRVVLFGPEDLHIVKGGKSIRRDFLDSAIIVHHPPYAQLIRGYQKLLKERNLLLREFGGRHPPPFGLMETYEDELARHGAQLLSYRLKYVREFSPVAVELVSVHTDSKLELILNYDCTIELEAATPSAGELAPILRDKLKERRSSDAAAGATSVGPHRDDLEIVLNGKPARFFASQGEQRQVAVSLKLAQLGVWKKRFNLNPILLLDDVMSELDQERSLLLFSLIAEWEVQTVISTTTMPDMLLNGRNFLFEVEKGRLERRQGS